MNYCKQKCCQNFTHSYGALCPACACSLETEIKDMDEMCKFFARAIRDCGCIEEHFAMSRSKYYCPFCEEENPHGKSSMYTIEHTIDCAWVTAGEYLEKEDE